jgi:hypothetical protein
MAAALTYQFRRDPSCGPYGTSYISLRAIRAHDHRGQTHSLFYFIQPFSLIEVIAGDGDGCEQLYRFSRFLTLSDK